MVDTPKVVPVSITIETAVKGQPIIVATNEYKGKLYVDIRRYFTDDQGELRATPKGISIPWDLANEVCSAFQVLLSEQEAS